MADLGFISKRVKKKPQTGLTTDRYQFLGLDQAEPDLGDPLVGLSSVGANPAPIGGSKYVLIAAGGNTGKRYWIDTSNLSSTGLIPGSFTVFNNSIQVGAANSFNKFNFVGSGVTVDPVSSLLSEQTGIATVRITVTDLIGPGNINSIPYKSNTGFLAGANDFVYVSGNIGIGSTQPTVVLDIIGNQKVSGIITATGGFVGSLTGIASTATNLADAANITTGTISSSRLSGSYGISITGTATTANNVSSSININTSGIITATGGFVGSLTGIASTATNLADAANITTGTISSSRLSGSYDISITGTATTAISLATTTNVTTTGIITATGGFEGNLTGIASTAINVVGGIASVTILNVGTGGTIITTTDTGLVGIGTTNPTQKLSVYGAIESLNDGGNEGGNLVLRGQPGTNSRWNIDNHTSISSSIKNQFRIFREDEQTGLNGSTYLGITTVGEVIIGDGPINVYLTPTGTENQKLQVQSGAYISGNLGIGTTNPKTLLQIETYGIKTGVGTFTASVGVSTTIDSFSVSSTDFKTAEYTVHIGFGSYIQAQKILVMQNQTTAYSEEYGVMYNNSLIVSIGATISGGNCILQATPQTGVSGLTTYRFVRNTLLQY